MSLWCDDFYVTPQGYYVIKVIRYKVITSRYTKVIHNVNVTMTLTNHRPFQNRPTLDAKKMHFCSSESHESTGCPESFATSHFYGLCLCG